MNIKKIVYQKINRLLVIMIKRNLKEKNGQILFEFKIRIVILHY